jgi:tRNA threonylcarbamoyl adenosine modification protein YeaZ
MKILALEFASEQRGVAVIVDGQSRGTATEIGGRETRACGLIERALQQAGLKREAIDCVVVGLGPGSYTGIRAAISWAQGWQLGRGVRLLGISTVECLSAQAQEVGIRGTVHIAIDAQRREFYLATYGVSANGRKPIESLHLATLAEVKSKALAGTLLIWPGSINVLPEGKVLLPDAAQLGQLAAGRSDFVSGEKLEPIYLREPGFIKAPAPRFIQDLQK